MTALILISWLGAAQANDERADTPQINATPRNNATWKSKCA